MLKKYGKSIKDILDIKIGFFEENEKYLKYQNKINEIYSKQPRRKYCKICREKMVEPTFSSHGLNYFKCPKCGHLNGEFEETKQYSEEIYNHTEYDTFYVDKDINKYNDRVEKIYMPKLEFLLETIGKEKLYKSRLLDVGAGAGYFCKACGLSGVTCKGIEISSKQVDYGCEITSGSISLKKVEAKDSLQEIKYTDCNIVTMFGVLESVYNLHEMVEAISKNKNIEYFYFSIPMFSLSCVLESIHPESFNRNLGGAHTHLFTSNSIGYLLKEYNFELISMWQFGSDIMDMFRFIGNCLKLKNEHKLYTIYEQNFVKMIDDLQLIVDKNGFGSEIHIVAKKK